MVDAPQNEPPHFAVLRVGYGYVIAHKQNLVVCCRFYSLWWLHASRHNLVRRTQARHTDAQ